MSDLMQGISALLKGGWDMITGVTIPGTDFSVAALLVALFIINLGLRLLGVVLGFHFSSDEVHSAFAPPLVLPFSPEGRTGSGSGGVAKISPERKHDQF